MGILEIVNQGYQQNRAYCRWRYDWGFGERFHDEIQFYYEKWELEVSSIVFIGACYNIYSFQVPGSFRAKALCLFWRAERVVFSFFLMTTPNGRQEEMNWTTCDFMGN